MLQDLGSNAKGKMDAFERIKQEAEALEGLEEESDEDNEEYDVFDDASAESLALADTSDPEELKRQLKE
jgi:hypothetical protein